MSMCITSSIVSRGQALQANSSVLEKSSYLHRKAIFIDPERGLMMANKPTASMAMALNPSTMMDSMMQGMVSSVYYLVIISGFSMMFSGFIIAKLPFVVTSNLKLMLQQGITNGMVDISYISTMSLLILIMYSQSQLQLLFGEEGKDDMMQMTGTILISANEPNVAANARS